MKKDSMPLNEITDFNADDSGSAKQNKKYLNIKKKRDKSEPEVPQKKQKAEISVLNNGKIFFYITKSDKMKILYFLIIPSESFKPNSPFSLMQKFVSVRNDIWLFSIDFNVNEISQLGKFTLQVSVKNENLPQSSTIISKIFSNVQFTAEVSVSFSGMKIQNFTLPNLSYHSLPSTIEVLVSPDVYKGKDSLVCFLEFGIIKGFDVSELPYNGIINEGATCYMNSMLQNLNSITPFKKAVFQIPTETEHYSSSVALSLQRIFYDLSTTHKPASTKSLLKSFGWSREQIQIQHDVQEFNLLLSDLMQTKMMGTQSEGIFDNLFEGKLKNYIQCVHVNCNSERVEKFSDLQLTVKNYKNIYQSLDAYTEEEILDNENKYETEKFGKQTAKKGIKFISFPPILTLQLKRFEYNSKRETMVKINDFFEYPDQLDLSKYLTETNDDNIYILHTVVVHQGNANSGHYFAYIKPTTEKDWLKFNDENVRPADYYEIFQQNFGGSYEVFKHKGKDIISNHTNFERTAYILVYIKKSIEKDLVENINQDIIPSYLKRRFDSENEEEEKSLKKKKRNNENVNVLLISNQNCYNHINKLGIVNSFFDVHLDMPLIYNTSYRMLINFPKNLTIGNFVNFISEKANIPKSNLFLYDYSNSENFQILSRSDFELTLINTNDVLQMSLIDYKVFKKKTFLSFFLYVKGNYTLFANITSFKEFNEEIEYNNCKDKIIYVSKLMNKYYFKFNQGELKDVNIQNPNQPCIIGDLIKSSIVILFIKRYDSSSKTLSLDKIIDITVNHSEKDKIFSSICSRANCKVSSFLIERTSPVTQVEPNSPKEILFDETNAYSILSSCTSLILIPVQNGQADEIISFFSTLYLTFYIDAYSFPSTKIIKKMKIDLKLLADDYNLREAILKHLKEKHLIPSIINIKDHYYINKSRKMQVLTEEFLKNTLSPDNVELFNDKDQSQRPVMNAKDYKALSFLNLNECKYVFKLNLYHQSELAEYTYQDIYLYDIHNNETCLISAMIPRKIKKSCDVLDYLYDILQSKNLLGYMKKNYYFILQSKTRNFAYNIIVDGKTELRQFEVRAKDIEYRLQPFVDNDIVKFQNSEYKKVFISFNGTTTKFDPIINYFFINEKFFDIKREIAAIINKRNENFRDFNIYKGMLQNGRIIKESSYSMKDNDTLESFYKDYSGVINLYIDLIK